MKFNLLIEELLNEALTPEEIHDKYYKDINKRVFNAIIKSDPQTVVQNNRVTKIGKYAKILLNLYRNNELKFEDLARQKENLELVYKYNVPLDINKIKTQEDIDLAVSKYKKYESSDINQLVGQLDPNEYKLVFNGENWLIYVPNTEKAACYLGSGTEWCTAWGQQSTNKTYQERENRFKYHHDQGPLYVIISKEDTNEKYQFHFESNQYMDKRDVQINTGEFFKNNPEVRNFFFPSFIRKVKQDELERELSRIDLLSSEDSMTVLSKSIQGNISDNELGKSLLGSGVKNELIYGVEENIEDDNIEFLQVKNKRFKITIKKDIEKVPILRDLENTLYNYKYDIQNSWDRLSDDLSDSDYTQELIVDVFKSYYEKEKNTINSKYGIPNYDLFHGYFFEEFYEAIRETFVSETITLSATNYELRVQQEIDDIEKYIEIEQGYSNSEVSLNLIYFVRFLMQKNIKQIKNNLFEVIEDYIDFYRISTDYEYIYDFNYEYPEYGKNTQLTREIDEFFENKMDDDQKFNECIEYKKKLNEIVKNLFKGKSEFENEHVLVKITDHFVDCQDGTIKIHFHNKDTNKKYDGKVKVENLPSYVTNYQLFENFVTFKKNILKG